MEYFVGTFEYALDEAGRLNVPSKYRKVLQELGENRLMVSKAQSECLTLYPYKSWKKQIADKIAELSHSRPNANHLRRLLGTTTAEVLVDKQGRINVLSESYAKVGIEKNVLIVGAIDTIELWSPASYERFCQDTGKTVLEELEYFGI